MKLIQITKIVIAYAAVIFTGFFGLLSAFFSFKEAFNRYQGIETESARKYILAQNTAVIYNSVIGLFGLGMTLLQIYLLYKKRYIWTMICCVVVWLISFEIDFYESLLLR